MTEKTTETYKDITGNILSEKVHEKVTREVMRYRLIYSVSGLILGLICVLGGIILFLNGIVGDTNWTAKVFSMESELSDAGPGSILFVVGLFIVFITRYKN